MSARTLTLVWEADSPSGFQTGRYASLVDCAVALGPPLSLRDISPASGREASGRRVVCLMTTDERIRELNRQHRGVDRATDVLSFPTAGPTRGLLGDVAISLDTAERQAIARGVSLEREVASLIVHGTLHLLGYDDDTPEDRQAMLQAMNACLVGAGYEPDDGWCTLDLEVLA